MEELKMFYHLVDGKKKGYVNSVEYGDKVLATYNKETDLIDLSVLNPFVNKPIKLITVDIETGIAKVSNKLIHRVEDKKNGHFKIHMQNYIEEECSND